MFARNNLRFRSSHRRCSVRKGVLRKAEACNVIKKETLAQVFSCEFCEISKNTFFTEKLRATTSVVCDIRSKFLLTPTFLHR